MDRPTRLSVMFWKPCRGCGVKVGLRFARMFSFSLLLVPFGFSFLRLIVHAAVFIARVSG